MQLACLLRRTWIGVAGVSAAICLLLLAGCSPEYNWREVKPAGLGFQATFPGKPGTASRDVQIDGQKFAMSVVATQAGGHSFSVGVLQLNNDTPAHRERILAVVREQMLRNVAATQSSATPAEVAVLNPQGATMASESGQRIEAQAKTQPNRLFGVFVAHGTRVYQCLVIGQNPESEQVQLFIESFRLLD